MKRRAFLTMLGLAPIVAQALPRPANPSTLAKGGPVIPAKYIVGEKCVESIIAGTLRSKDNRMVLHLSEGRITFKD